MAAEKEEEEEEEAAGTEEEGRIIFAVSLGGPRCWEEASAAGTQSTGVGGGDGDSNLIKIWRGFHAGGPGASGVQPRLI
jgi:hypothetical protein